ncbi:cell division protein FtsK [Candidatus Epulonipiscioides gigas]|nr:cell division protein FtsK [Epulopiscium sp. SCG-C07WGA-EpuloA2]
MKKKRKKKNQINKMPEVVGVSIIGCCVLIIASIFTEQTGIVGNFIKSVTVGLLGIGGYALPFYMLFLGVMYIRNGQEFVLRNIIKMIPTFIFLILLVQLNASKTQTMTAIYTTSYFYEASYINGGLVGGVITNTLLKFLGLYGTYILVGAFMLLWLFLSCNFSFITWLRSIPVQIKFPQLGYSSYNTKKPYQKRKVYKKIEPQKNIGTKIEAPSKVTQQVQPQKRSYKQANIQNKVSQQTQAPEAPKRTYTKSTVNRDMPIKTETAVSKPKSTKKNLDQQPVQEMIYEKPQIYMMEQNQPRTQKKKSDNRWYQFPDINLLNKQSNANSNQDTRNLQKMAMKLEDTLLCFGIEARVVQVYKGPSVTRYEIAPKQGIKVSKILNLSDDIALSLAAKCIRIEAPIPGKSLVGIEIPNEKAETIFLRDIIDTDIFDDFSSKLAFAIGKDISGAPVVYDITKMPHMLIAGATGSGKSVCINTLIASILYKATPDEVQLIMIDPKVVELNVYNGIPHLLMPVVTDPKEAAKALSGVVTEMTNRYKLFADNMVRDISGYNKKVDKYDKMPHMVVIIDELSDLMMTAAKEVEDSICRLAQMARAAGIHLVIATQRPSVDVITGVIKANIPSRLAFAVSSGIDSRTILDSVGAEKLLGKGDMLFCPMGEVKPIRIQGAFISDKEVEALVNAVKNTQYAKLA